MHYGKNMQHAIASAAMVILSSSATDIFNPVLASSSQHFTEMMALVARISVAREQLFFNY